MGDRRRSRTELRKGAPAFVDNANTGRRTGKFIPTVQLDEDGFESIEGLFGSQAYTVDAPKQRARRQLATVVENSYVEEEETSMELTRVENDVDMDDYDIPEVVKREKVATSANKPASSSGNKSNAAASGSKSSARAPTPPPPVDEDMEDDIANGLAQLNAGPDEEDEPEPEPEPPALSKKAKEKEKAATKAKAKAKDKGKGKETDKRPREEEEEGRGSPKKARAGKGKENTRQTTVEPVGRKKKRDFNASTPPNVRRSQRERFSPLEWWRGEKFVYGRSPDPEEGPLLVPLIKAIERPPKPPTVALSKKGGKKGGKRVKVKKEEGEDGEVFGGEGGVFGAPRTQEDGMDDETEELGIVMDYATGREVERRIAFPGARVDFNPSDGPFSFQKIFGDSDFFAAGVMKIPVGGKKPNKPSKENTFVFYCVSGAVEVKVHKSTFTIAPGGMFLAPRGNVYTIANVSQRDAYIFFAQSRKVLDDSEEPPPLP
ncbi:hypothetical protein FRC11_006615, partial [Ceratobasidium sp. 423]